MKHNLTKTNDGWYCSECNWTFKSKNRGECYGVPRLSHIPDNLATVNQLKKYNLTPVGELKATVVGTKTHFLYSKDNVKIDNPNLSPVFVYGDIPDGLFSKYELGFENLKPYYQASPMGYYYRYEKKYHDGIWVELYSKSQCIEYTLKSKTQIKSELSLTQKQLDDLLDYCDFKKSVRGSYNDIKLYWFEQIKELWEFESMANIRLTADNDDDITKLEYLLDCKSIPYSKSKKYKNRNSNEFRVYFEVDLNSINIPDTGLSPKEGDLVLSPNNK
jgi:hypothetical protein